MSQLVAKLYQDKITLSKYKKPTPTWKYYDFNYKQNIQTGELERWTMVDFVRCDKNYASSLERSLDTIKDLSEKNTFDYFLTMTFNPKYVDRTDPNAVYSLFKNVMKRLKYHLGKMSYIAVAEHHRDKKAIHYHILVSFEKKPKLLYSRNRGKGGHALYWLKNDFKKCDCMLQISKLESGNNIRYLTKYMTKSCSTPMPRRFSATRGLARSRVVDSIRLDTDSQAVQALALLEGFDLRTQVGETWTYQYKTKTEPDTHGGGTPRADLSCKDIIDENLSDIFYDFIIKLKNSLAVRHKVLEVSNNKQKVIDEGEKQTRELHEQLVFGMEKNGVLILSDYDKKVFDDIGL